MVFFTSKVTELKFTSTSAHLNFSKFPIFLKILILIKYFILWTLSQLCLAFKFSSSWWRYTRMMLRKFCVNLFGKSKCQMFRADRSVEKAWHGLLILTTLNSGIRWPMVIRPNYTQDRSGWGHFPDDIFADRFKFFRYQEVFSVSTHETSLLMKCILTTLILNKHLNRPCIIHVSPC